MSLNYAIFRSNPIYTLSDLSQIGLHNKRKKKNYKSNPDINIQLSTNNIDIVPLVDGYVKGFNILTKEYKKQHDKKMKTERVDRKRTYNQMINESKSVVADELLFTVSNKFFEHMTTDDIKEWANTCMDFVYKDLGYTKEQVLHATIHMDEKTPHIHCVVVPLIKKFDKRTNCERYTISKKQYIKDKIHLSKLQDKYHARLVSKGYGLERGIKGSNRQHLSVNDFKKINRIIKQDNNIKNNKLIKTQNKEIEILKLENNQLKKENLKLKRRITIIITTLKILFRQLLELGTETIKVLVSNQIKKYFSYNVFNSKDIYQVSRGTTKEDELFKYAKIPNFYKSCRNNNEENNTFQK